MISPNFSALTKAELRAYIIAHPNDKAAFHVFVDRFTPGETSEVFDLPRSNAEVEQVEALIKQKLGQLEIN